MFWYFPSRQIDWKPFLKNTENHLSLHQSWDVLRVIIRNGPMFKTRDDFHHAVDSAVLILNLQQWYCSHWTLWNGFFLHPVWTLLNYWNCKDKRTPLQQQPKMSYYLHCEILSSGIQYPILMGTPVSTNWF